MITREKARLLRKLIERMSAELPDSDAFDAAELFPAWDGNSKTYEPGDRVQYESTLYKCLQSHTSQSDWMPDISPSLWVRIDDPAIEWPEWIQPTGATDAYRIGAKVSHNEKHWISQIDYNTYEPGVYGWEEVNG